MADSVHKKIVLLTGCGILAVGAGIGTAFAYRSAQAALPVDEAVSSAPSVSMLVSSSQSSSSATLDSSDSEDAVKEDVALTLVPSSATQDLNINIVDADGNIVSGVVFQLHVVGTGQSNSDYDHVFDIDLKDGNLYLSWIPEGPYQISLREEEGFITPEPVEFTVEKFVVVYDKIDNIADQIVSEEDVNVSEDDNAFDSSGPSTGETPTVTDTLPFVESTKKESVEYLKDDNGNYLYTYTYSVGANGCLLLANGTESAVEPVLKDKVLVSGIRYTKTGSTATSAAAASFASGVPGATLLGTPAGAVLVRPLDETLPSSSQESSSPAESSSSEAPSSSVPESSSSTPEPSVPSSKPEASVPSDSETTHYTVTFLNVDKSVISTVSVTPGGTATAPSKPTFSKPGYRYVFTGWSAPYDKVQQNLSITAVYDIYKGEDVKLFKADNTPDPTYKITAQKQSKKIYVYTGWQTIEGKTYYYTADHKKATGWQVIQGISYFFDSKGVRSDCIGIDVSRWNGSIDWKAVKASGINFAIIRVGYRGYGTGKLVEDPLARQNLAGASAAGLKLGVYVFSQAINLEEAVEEASMALEVVKGYSLAYPIFIDSEYSNPAKDGRADNLSVSQRTAICTAFCKTIANNGYRTGVYASKSWFMYQLSVSELSSYHIWMAHYTTATDYPNRYDMWQYSSTGSVPGISGHVDMNLSYLNY